ncbi:MAG: uracil-DNA glycosylase [Bacteroidetes bacterium]|nr:uracil-DNA glycosylase [Bacteroidota bacterium]
MSVIKLHESWLKFLEKEFDTDYMKNLRAFLLQEKAAGKTVYPQGNQIFEALNLTPFNKVKVLILGQDPYHGVGQAHGLSFSVQDGVKFPPSLQNIFKELGADLNIPFPRSGNLTKWAEQGVLLLNATLTVRQSEAGSHQNKGWELFTDKIIRTVSEQKSNVVFLLWGKFAQDKATLIDSQKHLVLMASHPSPFSADRGFFGCKHFSKTNEYLINNNIAPVDWRL